jgi:lysophospholipase L1-like esterase
MSRRSSSILAVLSTAVLTVAALPAAAQTRYLAFGDSITFGVGDDETRTELGYPPRLEELLVQLGVSAEVVNEGLPGESTFEAQFRLEDILDAGSYDVLLLMEGTNDVPITSPETTRFNLDQLALEAENRGLDVVHATTIPRLPSAGFDGENQVTRDLAGEIRELAYENNRDLVDPFEVFMENPAWFDDYYVGGSDKLHPNSLGYDVMASAFADVLTGADGVAPVVGELSPFDDEQRVEPNRPIVIDLYDFGAGIDTTATRLLIDGQEVAASISGDSRRQEIRYSPPSPWSLVVRVELEAQDLASPPHVRDGELVQFVIRGARFLDGDIDRDGIVAGNDLVALAVRFGSQFGEARYRGFADFNSDGIIDGEDLAILSRNFGMSAQ